MSFASVRRLLPAALISAALGIASLGASPANAFCTGLSCLPGTGYAYDNNWNCGVISTTQSCYSTGTLSYSNGLSAGWGWGSADYDGGGSTAVNLDAHTTSQSFFGGTGTNLIRACYHDNCNDQDSVFMRLRVASPSANHTILGHGKA